MILPSLYHERPEILTGKKVELFSTDSKSQLPEKVVKMYLEYTLNK